MRQNLFKSKLSLAFACSAMAVTAFIASCDKKELTAGTEKVSAKSKVAALADYSVTPSLVKTLAGFESININTIISSDDKLTESPDFVYGAQPDGAGLLKNPNGEGYIMITNHEILQSVSRVYLDKDLKPLKGEYIVNGTGGRWRLCSATMATPQEHGFGPLFLTAGESGVESMIHAIDPFASAADKANTERVLPAFGKCSAENAVPLPKNAYPGQTAIFIGEDESNPANTMGQVNLYLSETGDLQNGKLYMLRRPNKNVVETDMEVGSTYDVEFAEYTDVKTSTGAQLQAQTLTEGAIQFARVEDLDYGKGGAKDGRTLYFVATGISQADKITPVAGATMWGRLYKLVLDDKSPLKGKLTPLIDGNENPGNSIVNPDNVCVTKNYVYIQEDGDSFYKETKHDGRIWQYCIGDEKLKPMIEMNHRRDNAEFNAKYNSVNSPNLSSWEYGAMFDISNLAGKPGAFIVNIHPHTWRDDKFKWADGSQVNTNNEGGQTVILTGVPK